MRIPKTFKLFAQTWEVKEDEVRCNAGDATGLCAFRAQEVYLMPRTSSYPFKPQLLEQTFCHELMHAMTHLAGLSLSETEIDTLGSLLHQFLETRAGELGVEERTDNGFILSNEDVEYTDVSG